MKRFFTLVLALLMLAGLIGCDKQPPESTPYESSDIPAASLPETEPETDPPETEPPFDYESYLALSPVSHASYQTVNIGFLDNDALLSFSLPKSWKVDKQADRLVISNGENEIGEIVKGVPDDPAGTRVMEYLDGETGDISYWYNLLAFPTEKDTPRAFRHSITFSHLDNTVTVIIHYTEMDENAVTMLLSSVDTPLKSSDPGFDSISLYDVGDRCDVLILGNSFVGTSQIGSFLSTMFRGTNYRVTAISRGYATVSKNTWEDQLPALKAGTYDVVFLCGFYSEADTPALKPYIEACEGSDTTLVLFPAHNESREQLAIDTYPNLPVLHWQDEIDLLIKGLGIDYWDFCYNDSHKHSTPLAGYVGAHMIYRALTGEVPPIEMDFTALSGNTISYHLGTYMKTGSVVLLQDYDIWFLP